MNQSEGLHCPAPLSPSYLSEGCEDIELECSAGSLVLLDWSWAPLDLGGTPSS